MIWLWMNIYYWNMFFLCVLSILNLQFFPFMNQFIILWGAVFRIPMLSAYHYWILIFMYVVMHRLRCVFVFVFGSNPIVGFQFHFFFLYVNCIIIHAWISTRYIVRTYKWLLAFIDRFQRIFVQRYFFYIVVLPWILCGSTRKPLYVSIYCWNKDIESQNRWNINDVIGNHVVHVISLNMFIGICSIYQYTFELNLRIWRARYTNIIIPNARM